MVYRFKLDFNLGFGYSKLLDFTDVDQWNGILIKVFDFKSIEPLKNADHLEKEEYLLNPIAISRFPNIKGPNAWTPIGTLESPDDDIIPVFKGVHSKTPTVEDESKLKFWYPIYNFYKEGQFCDYEQVAHLEKLYLSTTLNVVTRATMEFLRKENRDITDYYDVNDLTYLWDYYRAINMPLFKDIPIAFRGKLKPKSP